MTPPESLSGLHCYDKTYIKQHSATDFQGNAACFQRGAVAISSALNHEIACSRDSPHISAEGSRPEQHAGRSGEPKMAQRNSLVRWGPGSPAGLFSDEMDGAMQQAPQPGRQAKGGEAALQGCLDMPYCRRLRVLPRKETSSTVNRKKGPKTGGDALRFWQKN